MAQRKGAAVRAAAGVLAAGVMVATMGVAGASGQQQADATIATTIQNRWDPAQVAIETGDTVTWNFDGSQADHNMRGTSGPPEDTLWPTRNSGYKRSGQYTYTFNVAGSYAFVCDAHPGMEGVVTVTGDPVEPTPVPTETGTASPTATPSRPGATATPDRTTPAPTGGARADTTAPAISRLSLKAITRGARLSFALSEPAAVTIRVRKGKAPARTVRLAARSGTRSITLRRLARGRYSVEVEARDARGNKAAVQRKSVRVKR